MPKIIDHVTFLSQTIGPRPAGTEEEQQAALYIAEQMQSEAELPASIEDFNSMPNQRVPWAICCGASLLLGILSLFLPILGVPAIIVTLVTAILLVLEVLDKPVLSRFFARGVSQNIVAKYEPTQSSGEASGGRRRKMILVARYDSGKVTPEYSESLVGVLPILYRISLGAAVLLPILLIIKNVFLLHAVGVVATIMMVLIIVALIALAIPVVFFILHQLGSYNEAANSNAAGVAVLLDIAKRLGQGEPGMSDGQDRYFGEPRIHGEAAAREQNLIPDGARVSYEDDARSRGRRTSGRTQNDGYSTDAPTDDGLASAKAAVAAMTGVPIPEKKSYDIADNLVKVNHDPVKEPTQDDYHEMRSETQEALTGGLTEGVLYAEAPQGMNEQAGAQAFAYQGEGEAYPSSNMGSSMEASSASGGVPDWFKKGQEQAKKPEKQANVEVQRSRYADALDAAISDSSSNFATANNIVNNRVEEQLQKMRDDIMEVRPPQTSRKEMVSAKRAEQTPHPQAQQSSGIKEREPNRESEAAKDVQGDQRGEQPMPQVSQHPQQGDLGETTAIPPIDVSDLRQKHSSSRFVESDGAVEQSAEIAEEAAAPEASSQDSRQPIRLPDIGLSSGTVTPHIEATKQRAPLAQAEESSTSTAKSLLNMLPSIDVEAESQSSGERTDIAKSGSDRGTAAETLESLPGLGTSDALTPSGQESSPSKTGSISTAGSFATAGATGAFAPIGDELIENVDPDDLYIDDADDSEYEGGFTETGAFAGPGYVDMPKSRVRRFFGRFGKNKDEDERETSTSEWLDVDEDFEARNVGAARGGWESFRQEEQSEPYAENYEDDFEDEDYSVDSNAEPHYYTQPEDDDQDFEEGSYDYVDRDEKWQGGAFSLRRKIGRDGEEQFEDDSAEPDYHIDSNVPDEEFEHALSDSVQEDFSAALSDERESVYQFRYSGVDTEVWLVALGSELANESGMKAFIDEHAQDLKGAIIVNLEALGSGELTYVEREGLFKRVSSSSRMKRYLRKATQALGVSPDTDKMVWKDSAASYAMKKGYQAMSLVGMANGKPAYFAEKDDVLENVEENLLEQNSSFVMEMLKNM